MNVKTKEKQEENNFKQLVTGYQEVEPVAFNPTKEQLIKLLEVSEENEDKFKEPEYTGEKDGIRTARVELYVKSVKSGKVDKMNFFLKEEPNVSKSGATWYINQLGDTQVTDDTSKLFDNFTQFTNVTAWNLNGTVTEKYVQGAKPESIEVLGNKKYRAAYVGEAELVNFLKIWINGLDLRDPETDVLLDMKKIFNGNFKELQGLIGNYGNLVCAYSVKVTDDGKEYQVVESNYVAPSTDMKFINNFKPIPQNLDPLIVKYEDLKTRSKMKTREKFVAGLHNTSYPLKNYFRFGLCSVYEPSSNPINSNTAVVSDTSSQY